MIKYELKYLTTCPIGMFNLPGNIVSVYVDGKTTMGQIKFMLELENPSNDLITFDQQLYLEAVKEFFEAASFLQMTELKDYLNSLFRPSLEICTDEEIWDIKAFFRVDKLGARDGD